MSGDTAIRVISLDTEASSERRKLFEQMAQSSNVEWEFFSAFSGPISPVTYDDEKAQLKFGRSLLNSEIGCYTSHFKLWEWLANSPFNQAIVFEDDTMIDWTFIGKLANKNFNELGIDILRLFCPSMPTTKSVLNRFLQGKYHLSAVIGPAWGTQGYLISKVAAARLVGRYSKIDMPIDGVLSNDWEHHLVNYLLFPAPLLERDIPSTIGFRDHFPDRPGFFGRAGKLRQFLYAANMRPRRKYYYLRVFPKMVNLAKVRVDSAKRERT